jgi:hypothetical protein
MRKCDDEIYQLAKDQALPRRHKVLTHRQERFFRMVTSVSIQYFIEWLDTFPYILRPADVTVKEISHIRHCKIYHTPFMSSYYGTLVRVAIGESTCNACHNMV